MSNTNLTQSPSRTKTKKYQHVVFSINPDSSFGREQARNLLRAHFQFVLSNLDLQQRRKFAYLLTDMSTWLMCDEMLRDSPDLAKHCGLTEKELDCDLSQLGYLHFSGNRREITVTLNRRSYFMRLQQARQREQRLRIAAQLLHTSTELAEVA